MNNQLYENYYTQVEKVDSIIKQFWMNGFLTISRKFGKYLPEPELVGEYSVEAIGKSGNKYAIGLLIQESDLEDKNLLEKIRFLATRQSKYTHKRVTLFIGTDKNIYVRVKAMIATLPADIRKSIKITPFTVSGISKASPQRNLFN